MALIESFTIKLTAILDLYHVASPLYFSLGTLSEDDDDGSENVGKKN